MIGMISFSVLNEKWTRKITNHYMEQEKIKKVRKSLVTSGFFKNPVISFSVLRAKKNPHPSGWGFFLVVIASFAAITRVMSPTSVARWGSDPTAASGGCRKGSEWPGSARDAGALSPRTFAGHPNRVDMQNRSAKTPVTKIKPSPADPTRKGKVIPTGMAFPFEAARNSGLQGGFSLTYYARGGNMNTQRNAPH